MENYVDGKEYFLKGTAHNGDSLGWSVEFYYNNGIGKSCGKLSDEPGILLTAEEVAAIHNRDIVNLERAVEELREENETLRKKIEKHEMTIEERTIECNRWEGMYDKASKKCDELRKRNDELTAWYEEANKTASEAAEANDELKAKIAKLKADLDQRNNDFWAMKKDRDELDSIGGKLRAENEALKDKQGLQKALEALNKDIDGYRATIQKMASVIGFLCGTEGGQNDKV